MLTETLWNEAMEPRAFINPLHSRPRVTSVAIQMPALMQLLDPADGIGGRAMWDLCVCVLFTWSNKHFGGGSVPVSWPEGVCGICLGCYGEMTWESICGLLSFRCSLLDGAPDRHEGGPGFNARPQTTWADSTNW